MKKTLALAAVTLMLALLAACSSGPEGAVRSYLDAIKKQDFAAASSYVNAEDAGATLISAMTAAGDTALGKKITEAVTSFGYKVTGAEIEGNFATVKVEIETLDIAGMLSEAAADSVALALGAAKAADIEAKMLESLEEKLKGNKLVKPKTAVEIKLVKSGEQWLIEPGGTLTETLTGGANGFAAAFGSLLHKP